MRSIPRCPLLNVSEDAKPILWKPLFAGVGGNGVDFVEMSGGFAVIDLGEGASFNGNLCEGEFGFSDGRVENGNGGPGRRCENEVVNVGCRFVVGL